MRLTFDKIKDHTLRHEGGYTDHPHDDGGTTKYGITIETYRVWRGTKRVTKEQMASITVEEAQAIWRALYWNPNKCDNLPFGVDYIVFDTSLLCGIRTGARFLQDALGVEVDGFVGPKTIQASHQADSLKVINRLVELRAARHRNHAKARYFLKGWMNRLVNVQQIAQGLIIKVDESHEGRT